MQVPHSINEGEYGRTLVAGENIARGRTIWRYDDAVETEQLTLEQIRALPETKRRMFEMYCWQVASTGSTLCDGVAPGVGVVALWEGVTEQPELDPLNFIDHSCQPNMHFRGDNELVARRDIIAGAPLTLEYATCDTVYARLDECRCGAVSDDGTSICRKKVTERDAYSPEIRRRYEGQMRSCIEALV